MAEVVPSLLEPPEGYGDWLAEVKARVVAARQRAVLAVNLSQLALYREIGQGLLDRQEVQGWGAKVIDRLAHDLRTAFPDMQGFSARNLRFMRDFARAWPDDQIWQRTVAKLPWGHNTVLLSRLKTTDERLAYAAAALERGWSRAALELHIEARTVQRTGQALTNFQRTLPAPQSDLAREALKDPYKLDFLGLGENVEERVIEQAMVDHITDFLVELGAGFAYVGRQVHITVGTRDAVLDLLFFHLKLRCYIVIELKAIEFEPAHVGQLGFYMAAVDANLARPDDGPTIGLLLCKTKDRLVAEYALRNMSGPLGVAEYDLASNLPDELAINLPSIAQIQRELADPAEPQTGV